SELSTEPNWLVRSFGPNDTVSGLVRDVVESGAALWALFTRRSGRFLAFAILLTPLTSLCSYLPDIPGLHLFRWIGGLFDPAEMLGGVTIAAILLWRAWTAWRGSERMQAELDAAREIQQRLVPAALPTLPGFTIEAAYIPAQEVGGDFYQVLPRPDGSTVIAVGDVSGKGLKAAMTGTLTIGALRTLAFDGLGPAAILHRLNDELVRARHDGFVTCLCAVLEPDSTLRIANAGHLPPLLDAAEIEMPGALPLGLAPGIAYDEQQLRLDPGQKLTLLSDGVLEATSASGELFGFDRTAAVSNQSAEAIAAAAQAHGQEDDITVLTLTFAPAEVPAQVPA
ncbi:MAG TPA: PP2C family protein-serine/threonine phosphatase, partial [Terracidiphilus sp.]